MLITGTATCKYCGKLVEWYYQIPNRMSDGIYNVEEIPEGKIGSSGKPCRLGEKRTGGTGSFDFTVQNNSGLF